MPTLQQITAEAVAKYGTRSELARALSDRIGKKVTPQRIEHLQKPDPDTGKFAQRSELLPFLAEIVGLPPTVVPDKASTPPTSGSSDGGDIGKESRKVKQEKLTFDEQEVIASYRKLPRRIRENIRRSLLDLAESFDELDRLKEWASAPSDSGRGRRTARPASRR